jgi:hypothetical protein
MFRARMQKALRGEYDGRPVAIGYVIQGKGKEAKKYSVYEPYRGIICDLHARFRALGWDYNALYKEVASKPCLFPYPPDGVQVAHKGLGKNAHGYIMTKIALKDLLTNVVYVGIWYVKGQPFIENNHPAIIDADTFWETYNHLNQEKADGVQGERARHHKTASMALLEGIVTSTHGRRVYALFNHDKPPIYKIHSGSAQGYGDTTALGSIYVADLDRLFEEHFLAEMEDVIGPAGKGVPYLTPFIRDLMHELTATEQLNTQVLDDQIAAYRTEAASLDNTLQYGSAALSPERIRTYSERLTRVETELAQLVTKRAHLLSSHKERQEAAKLLESVPGSWNALDLDKKRQLVRLLTDEIVLTKPAQNWLRLDITWAWFDRNEDVAFIWQRQGQGDAWSTEENERLCALYPEADRKIILEALPARSWRAIVQQASVLQIKRVLQLNTSSMPRHLSLSDKAFMECLGLDQSDPERSIWWTTSMENNDSCC